MDPLFSRVLLEFEDVFRDEEEEEEEEDEDDVVFFELRVDLLEEAFLFILSSSSLWLFSGCVFACRRRVLVCGFYRSGKKEGQKSSLQIFCIAGPQQAKAPSTSYHHIQSQPLQSHITFRRSFLL